MKLFHTPLLIIYVTNQSSSFLITRSSNTRPLTTHSENPINFAGTGPKRLVDMNKYNLPTIDDIQSQWTAQFVSQSRERDDGVYLNTINDRELFVDVISVSLPRGGMGNATPLGISLQEIAGGRSDGVGITIVDALIPDGLVYGTDILPGDVISRVSVIRRKAAATTSDDSDDADTNTDNAATMTNFSETVDDASVRTECLDYDATVAALRSLLTPPQSNDERLVLTLKRIRRKPKIKVNLRYPPSQNEPDESVTLYAGENLRLGMLVRGVKLNDPLAKRFDTKSGGNCGAGGLCRTCAVSVVNGGNVLNPQKVAEKQMLDDSPRWRLACKAFVGWGMAEGELTVRVNPRQWD